MMGVERLVGEKTEKVMGVQVVGSSGAPHREAPPIGVGEPNTAMSRAAPQKGDLAEAGLMV